MSKMDELRALREARYERTLAGAASKRPAKGPSSPATRPAAAPASAVEPEEGLCGHRSMNGRTCTRERGHAARNHRYS